MNFLPCRLIESNGGLRISLSDKLSLPVPDERAARYRPMSARS